MNGKYAYSSDGERYHGEFDTPEEAAAEYFNTNRRISPGGLVVPDDRVEVSVMREPIQPEECIEADELLEMVQCNEDYDSEFAESWPDANRAQREELTAEVRRVFGAWLDKHSLRPRFFICDEPITFQRNEIMQEGA